MSLTQTAPAASARRATSTWKVSAETGTGAPASPSPKSSTPSRSAAIPSIAGISAAHSSSTPTGGPLRAATAPTSSMSKPASTSPMASAIARSGVPLRAPSNIESTVTLTIPARHRSRQSPASNRQAAIPSSLR